MATCTLPKAPGADPWDAESSSLNNAYLASFKPVGPLITPQGTDSKLRGNFADASAQLDQDLGFATLTVLPAFRYSDVAALSYKDRAPVYDGDRQAIHAGNTIG